MKKNVKLLLLGNLVAGIAFFYFTYSNHINLMTKDFSSFKYVCSLVVLLVFLSFIISTVIELYKYLRKKSSPRITDPK
jgi:uncharacterized membrane protein